MLAEAPNLGIHTDNRVPRGTFPLNLHGIVWNLLCEFPEQGKRAAFSLDEVQSTLRGEVGGELPSVLIEQLGLDALDWQMVFHPNNLPILFLGAPNHQGKPINLREAQGTIAIDRRQGSRDSRVFVSDVRVAGVGLASDGSKRVMAVEYGAYHKKAREVNVSVSDQELPDGTKDLSGAYTWQSFHNVTMPIPSEHVNVYAAAGVTTDAMVAATSPDRNGVSGRPISAHRRMLRACDSTQVGDRVGFLDFGRVTRRVGFDVNSLDTIHRVSYDSSKILGQPTPPASWILDFPKKLA